MPDIKLKNRQGQPTQYNGVTIISVPLADGTGYEQYIAERELIDTEPLSVTRNGTFTAEQGKAYTPVTVNVQPLLQTKEIAPLTSEQEITADNGYYGLDKVVVGAIETEEKTAIENGEVLPSEGKYLSKVTVDVPLPEGRLAIRNTAVQNVYDYAEAQVVDVNLIPQNIVKNVPILGIMGTRETGGDVSVEGITITENGTYNAPSGVAYTPVMVNIPDPIQTATGVIIPPSTSVTVNYIGEIVKFYVEDDNGEIVLTDVDTNPTNVVFSCASAPYSTLTCTVVYDTTV